MYIENITKKKIYLCGVNETQNYLNVKIMENLTIQEKQLAAYNESKDICMAYINYNGDKRRFSYKRLERLVFEIAARRVNNFGKILGLQTFNELRGL